MSIIDRAIERINIPDMIFIAFDDATLFSNDVTARPMLIDLCQQKIFGGAVRFSHQVNHTFISYLMFAVITGAENRSSSPRQILYLTESGRFHAEEFFFSRNSLMCSISA